MSRFSCPSGAWFAVWAGPPRPESWLQVDISSGSCYTLIVSLTAPRGPCEREENRMDKATRRIVGLGVGLAVTATAFLWPGSLPTALGGTTERVNVASDGTEANWESHHASISADGRYVAFASRAYTLVPNDTNGAFDVFVHDRTTRQTTRVSVASNGAEGNNWSTHPSISADGRYVAFLSWATNLVPGGPERHCRCVCARPPDGPDDHGERRIGRNQGERSVGDSGDQRQRALRGVLVAGNQPARGHHRVGLAPLCARPEHAPDQLG